ncbi:hypothetical protein H0A36_23535 [Endozoicomonas sp. SM1973]|uniref:Lipoprotein n=1 Tax=Spartinivicinus marinus TaxID=2994442 RepID=A0A853IHU5_9GAMM|nr:hypothetical protein [Spartinivicinus marinus]MCX4025049.1 hypothetical protein [Spartinivicinus marinus]NYZ68997.1 hypothetical protein [Spartinivicinus marinus]
MKAIVTAILVTLLVGCASQPPVRKIENNYLTSSRSPHLTFKIPNNWQPSDSYTTTKFQKYNTGVGQGLFGSNVTTDYFEFIETESNSSKIDKIIKIDFIYGKEFSFGDGFANNAYHSQKREKLADGYNYYTGYLLTDVYLGKVTNPNISIDNPIYDKKNLKNCYLLKVFKRSHTKRKHILVVRVYKGGVTCDKNFKNNHAEVIKKYESELNAVANSIVQSSSS